MRMIGFHCPRCEGELEDSLTHCPSCSWQFDDAIARIARIHHETKLRVVGTGQGRIITEEEIATCLFALSVASEELSACYYAGIALTDKTIQGAFSEALK